MPRVNLKISLSKSKYIKLAVFISITLYFSLFFFRKIDLTTADLGRHLKNGEIFFVDIGIIRLNYMGKPCLVGLFHDITERKRIEEIRQQSHEELELRVQERTRELVDAVKKQNEYSAQLRRTDAAGG